MNISDVPKCPGCQRDLLVIVGEDRRTTMCWWCETEIPSVPEPRATVSEHQMHDAVIQKALARHRGRRKI